jgi:1-acyl-sn-glycerol-3-phosphate acyltransferase
MEVRIHPRVSHRKLLVKVAHQFSEWVMTRLARLLIRVFFRRVELEGGGNLPASGPVVLVANHFNRLVDGLLLMATLSR